MAFKSRLIMIFHPMFEVGMVTLLDNFFKGPFKA